MHVQYLRWIKGVFSGDFGEMIVMAPGTPIAEMLRKPLITTFWLTVAGVLVALTVGLTIGALSAIKPNSWLDSLSRVTSIATYSIPDFWLAIILLFVFGVIFRYRWQSAATSTFRAT